MNTKNPSTKAELTVKDVIAMTGLSNGYIRRAISKEWLKPDTTEPINNDGTQFRYLFSEKTIVEWREAVGNGSRRSDGRRKYNFYATTEEMKQFKEWKKEHIPEAELKLANPPKSA